MQESPNGFAILQFRTRCLWAGFKGIRDRRKISIGRVGWKEGRVSLAGELNKTSNTKYWFYFEQLEINIFFHFFELNSSFPNSKWYCQGNFFLFKLRKYCFGHERSVLRMNRISHDFSQGKETNIYIYFFAIYSKTLRQNLKK